MSTQNLVDLAFDATINENDIVFVDFWASWCAPCKQFARVYETIAGEFPDIVFAKVNIEEEKKLLERFELYSIPYLMIFKQGIVIYADAGTMQESTLRELAQQARDCELQLVEAESRERS